MIVQELYRLYGRLRDAGDLPPYGFSKEKVTGRIILRPDGTIFQLMDLRVDTPVGKKTVKRPRLLDVPQPPTGRTSAIKPGFLYDNAQYLLGWVEDGAKAARAADAFRAEAARHAAILDGVDDPGAAALLAFFRTHQPGQVPPGTDPELLAGFFVFRLLGDNIDLHDRPAIRDAWARAVAAEAGEAETGQCLVSGEPDRPIARIHPMLKGVPGAQTSGAALVSFNADAWCSYGKGKDNLNAPMSVEAAHGYTAALNHLLAQRGGLGARHVVIGAVSVVFWADRPVDNFEDEMALFISGGGGDDSPEDQARLTRLRDSLKALAEGRRVLTPEQRGARFFILGLSPNAARLAVRFWVADSLGVIAERVARHHRDQLLRPNFDGQPDDPPLWLMAMATKPYRRDGDRMRPDPNNDGLPILFGDLLRAVLTGGAYPDSLAAVLMDRFRADGVVNHLRLALLKAWLVRRRRIQAGKDKAARDAADAWGDSLVQLDTERSDPGYLLGRLFALLELIQTAALGRDINASIRDKYMGAASGTPGAVIPRLLTLNQHHLKKAKRDMPGWAHALEKRLADVMRKIDAGAATRGTPPFPPTLDLEQRGLFFLGYYHETGVRKSDAASPETAAEPASDIRE